MNPIEDCSEYFEKLSEIYFDRVLDNRKKIIQIHKVYKTFYKFLLSREQRHFSTLLAGISFINDRLNLDKQLIEKELSLTRLFRSLTKNPKAAASVDDVNFSFKYTGQIIKELSEFEPPPEISILLASLPELTLAYQQRKEKQRIDISGAVVTVNPFYKRKIDALYLELKCRHDDTGEFNLKIGYPFVEMANMIFEGMSFNLLGAEIIRTEPLTLSVHKQGLIIFEPDYLIDATDLAESYGFKEGYKIYFLKRYFSTGVSYALVLGNMVNTLFDEILINPDIDFEEAKSRAFKQKPLSMFALIAKGIIKPKAISLELELYYHKIQNIVKNTISENFKDAVFSVESSFISPVYGIQGRLDLLAEYPDDPTRKDIVELKSGNCPNLSYSITSPDDKKIPIGVWLNHLGQVIAYNLLLESTFLGRKGSSSILYVKSDDSPLRDVANFPNVIQQMVLHRNYIILLENAIQNGSYKFFENCGKIVSNGLPPYISDKINAFERTFNSLSEIEQMYLKEYSAFILRESYAVKTGGTLNNGNLGYSALWNESPDEKSENLNILTGLILNNELSDFENLHLVFDINDADVYTSFRNGDIAILFSYSEENIYGNISNQLLKCTIKSINSIQVRVSLRNKLISRELFNTDFLWRLEPDSMDSIDKLSYSSIYKFLLCKENKRQLLFGQSAPQFGNENHYHDENLNENQREIVEKAINCKDYFLIQGPPGTGKTNVVLKHIVKAIIAGTNENILITAYTNRAVDEMISSLKSITPELDYIRIGSKEASDDTERHLPNIIETYGLNAGYKKIKDARIVLSTVASILTNQELFDIKKFDTLIVDESSQILEPQLLGIIAQTGRFILIGDEKQLPPVVIQNETGRKCQNKVLNDIGLLDFSESLFERLIRTSKLNGWTSAFCQLEYQARMHKDIQEFPSRFFYSNTLKTAFENQSQENNLFNGYSDNPFENILASGRMIFIDCPDEKGKINKKEADAAIGIVNYLSGKLALNQNSIGIIAPFRIQCFELYKRLSESQKSLITVDTVERFQGSQREYIILSMATGSRSLLERAVSTDTSGMIDRKLNVALTRAKSHFILLGNSGILSFSEHYRSLINHIREKNQIFLYQDIIS
ncbi:MAG: AAA domain-containing protein [Candidatus Kapabacteria bacterium]|nr:AAA domain-containing protein [Candidatus Kapabacteria bacterium]